MLNLKPPDVNWEIQSCMPTTGGKLEMSERPKRNTIASKTDEKKRSQNPICSRMSKIAYV